MSHGFFLGKNAKKKKNKNKKKLFLPTRMEILMDVLTTAIQILYLSKSIDTIVSEYTIICKNQAFKIILMN